MSGVYRVSCPEMSLVDHMRYEARIDKLEAALARILASSIVVGLSSYKEAFDLLERIEDTAREALRMP